jgi:hypothetical protein
MELLRRICIESQHGRAFLGTLPDTRRIWDEAFCIEDETYYLYMMDCKMWIVYKYDGGIYNTIYTPEYIMAGSKKLTPGDRGKSVKFRHLVSQAARDAIYAWTLCARRLDVVRDLRIYIGKVIWERRHLFMP